MTDVNGVLQIKMGGHRREIIGIVIHVVAVARLGGSAVAAAVMGDHTIAVIEKEQHLRVPVIGRQRPAMAEHDGLTLAPILVKNLYSIFCFNSAHVFDSSILRLSATGHPRSQTPAYTSLVKKGGSMTNWPHFASWAAVGLAATVSSNVRPAFFNVATLSRMSTSMSRNSFSSDVLLTGLPCPGMMIVLSVAAARLASEAAIIPSMLPPVE